MKLSDIIDLAKAGYKPADIFKLLEYVENSPAVKDAAPEDLPAPDDLPAPEELPADEPLIKKEENKVEDKSAEDILKGLIQ